MANVVHITKDRTPHRDDLLLTVVGAWKASRAEARYVWAKQDADTKFSTKDIQDLATPSDAVDSMREAESSMTIFEPSTTLGVKVLLEAVLDILQARQVDPELSLANGPVIEILANVVASVSYRDVVIAPTK